MQIIAPAILALVFAAVVLVFGLVMLQEFRDTEVLSSALTATVSLENVTALDNVTAQNLVGIESSAASGFSLKKSKVWNQNQKRRHAMNTLEKQAMAGLEELMDLSTHEDQLDMARELIHRTNSSTGRWFWNKHKSKLSESVQELKDHMAVAHAHFESIRIAKEEKRRKKELDSPSD